MQQLKVEHENTTNKDRRSGKGRVIALSRRIYRLMQTDIFYVESESTDNVYYFVKFKPDVMEFCSCKDYESNRAQKCKHLYSIEFAIRMGTLKETDKLPEDAKRKAAVRQSTTVTKKSFIEDDDYSF
jgi:predicted nucleic acid-binding Zn finger protein